MNQLKDILNKMPANMKQAGGLIILALLLSLTPLFPLAVILGGIGAVIMIIELLKTFK